MALALATEVCTFHLGDRRANREQGLYLTQGIEPDTLLKLKTGVSGVYQALMHWNKYAHRTTRQTHEGLPNSLSPFSLLSRIEKAPERTFLLFLL